MTSEFSIVDHVQNRFLTFSMRGWMGHLFKCSAFLIYSLVLFLLLYFSQVGKAAVTNASIHFPVNAAGALARLWALPTVCVDNTNVRRPLVCVCVCVIFNSRVHTVIAAIDLFLVSLCLLGSH